MSQRQGQFLLIKIKSIFCQSMVKVGHCVTHTHFMGVIVCSKQKKKNGVKRTFLIYFQPKKKTTPQKYLLL